MVYVLENQSDTEYRLPFGQAVGRKVKGRVTFFLLLSKIISIGKWSGIKIYRK
jgi:hypothetical protein